jgi:cytochrome c biogenesis protein CcmG/thiol:disulfide interchange protein DsbE
MGNPQGSSARRRPSVVWTAVAVGFIVLTIALLIARGPGRTGDVSVDGRAAPGARSPDVSLVDFEGEPFSLSEYRGTPVVINFWASWCPSCVAEMPDFEKVHKDLRGEVAFIGIDQRDDRNAAEALAQQTGVTYRLAEDPDGRVFDAFGGVGMPTTAFIDADGNVVDVVTGQLTEELLREHINHSFGVDVGA